MSLKREVYCPIKGCNNTPIYYDYDYKTDKVVAYCEEHIKQRAPEYIHDCFKCGAENCVN